MPLLFDATVKTPLGPLHLRADARKIVAAQFAASLSHRHKSNAILRRCARELAEYFVGTRKAFRVGVRLQGTPFQCATWKALRHIPYGKTVTYGELARRIGRPKAARAVGSAVGKNPFLILLPCHRVVPSSGGIGKYAGGARRKAELLALEGWK